MLQKWLIVTALAAGFSAFSVQAQPTTAAATTSPHIKRTVVIPPGFHTIAVNQRTIILEPADEAWVRQALEGINPTTMPSTMPSDLLGQLHNTREQIKKQIAKDLALTDTASAEKFLTDKLEPSLKQLDEINPPLFYIVCSKDRVKQLLKDGWTDPTLYYNRAADDVLINPPGFPTGATDDDVLLPAIYLSDATPEQKKQSLINTISGTEKNLANMISYSGMISCRIGFAGLVAGQLSDSIKLKPDQQWLAEGITWILSTRYSAQLIGMNPDVLLQAITTDEPNMVFRPGSIDLMHPMTAADLRPEVVGAYTNAYQRKCARVVLSWITRGGGDAIPKTLAAIRKNPPADGDALLKLILQITNIDLTTDVRPGL